MTALLTHRWGLGETSSGELIGDTSPPVVSHSIEDVGLQVVQVNGIVVDGTIVDGTIVDRTIVDVHCFGLSGLDRAVQGFVGLDAHARGTNQEEGYIWPPRHLNHGQRFFETLDFQLQLSRGRNDFLDSGMPGLKELVASPRVDFALFRLRHAVVVTYGDLSEAAGTEGVTKLDLRWRDDV